MQLSLDSAIADLQAEIDSAAQGTKGQPKEGTAAWWKLRAFALGLSHLKRQKQLQTDDDPAAAERHYRECQSLLKAIDIPPEPDIVPEVLPAL